MSTSMTLTLTMSPALTTSYGSLTNFSDSAEMHQAVLVDADVDERAEVGDVGHHTLQDHARLGVLGASSTRFYRNLLES